MNRLSLLLLLVGIVTAVTAAIYDLRFRRIPNWLTVTCCLIGLSLNLLISGWIGFSAAITGMALAFVIYVPLYLIRATGAGDAKLMIGLGALVGPGNWLAIFLVACVLGGLFSAIYVIRRKRLYETAFHVSQLAGALFHLRAPYNIDPALDVQSPHSARLPFGASVAIAVLSVSAWLLFVSHAGAK
jgi:prepilin peptidase CpaA